MRKKLKSRLGVTILEMLVALLILSLLTAGGVAATSAVMADYNHMTEASNADILASTVIEAISNEIRLGRGITLDGDDAIRLEKSSFFGEDVKLKLDDDGYLVVETTDALGNPVLNQVLSERAYGGLKLEELTFTKITEGDPAGTGTVGRTAYEFSFKVISEASGELWEKTASAAPMFE